MTPSTKLTFSVQNNSVKTTPGCVITWEHLLGIVAAIIDATECKPSLTHVDMKEHWSNPWPVAVHLPLLQIIHEILQCNLVQQDKVPDANFLLHCHLGSSLACTSNPNFCTEISQAPGRRFRPFSQIQTPIGKYANSPHDRLHFLLINSNPESDTKHS